MTSHVAGAGLCFVSVNSDVSAPGYLPASDSDEDTALGFRFGGGLSAAIAPRVFLGAEIRYSIASVKLYDTNVSIDSLTIAGSLGYRP